MAQFRVDIVSPYSQ